MKKKFISGIVAALMIASAAGTISSQAAVVQQATKTIGTFQVVQPKDAVTKGTEIQIPVYGAGMYNVGKDLTAGEYLVLANSGTAAYFEVSKDSTGDAKGIVANGNPSTHMFVTVKDGQYLKVQRGTFLSPEKIVLQAPTDGVYREGTYRVGVDIPAGEYLVTASKGSCYLEVAKDSSHDLKSILSNDNFDANAYITVKNGEYLTVTRGNFSIKSGAVKDKEQNQVYWTSGGKSYHFTKDCVSLKRSKKIEGSSINHAKSKGKADPCNLCADGK